MRRGTAEPPPVTTDAGPPGTIGRMPAIRGVPAARRAPLLPRPLSIPSSPARRPRAGRRAGARLAAGIALVAILATVLAPSAFADSVRRTWTARFTGGAGGTARVVSYTSGTGLLALSLTGLQPNSVYPVLVYRGTCAAPSTVTRLPGFRTDAGGAITKSTALASSYLTAIWKYGRTSAIALKIGTGTLARCAPLTYPVATRVAIASLRIDLPVVRPPSGYPLCNVAMYIKELSQPREAGVTLIYAHARTGMFLPLLERSKVNNGASLIGMKVSVWTSDSVVSTYEITKVRRHVTSLDGVFAITGQQLWLQTSEGPRGTTQKLIVVARRLSSVAATWAAAHPTPHPVVCG